MIDGAPAPSATATRTTCPYCGVGCGVVATAGAGRAATIAGDPDHPANFGRLCSKGTALAETLSLDDRLLEPEVDGDPASWEAAIDIIARRIGDAIAADGPDSVAFYVSGQLLTEDYYVANKLMKGFIGSANIDTNSRLCMASSVAGHKRAFGSDTVPGIYEDLELADLVVLVGTNLAWCHPILYQRLEAARDIRGTKVVVIDPRRTATCEIADRHLALAGGSDIALFNGLLAHLAATGAVDRTFVDRHTRGWEDALATAQTLSKDKIAALTGLTANEIDDFYRLFARTERVVTVFSQGVNQSIAGTDKVNAIINCHLATGRIGRPGAGPFSVTGQPNAMGGREVGGLANTLAAHMDIENADHRRLVRRFWGSPTIASKPGLKAVDLFRAVADGRIKALWIMATNPVDSMPEANAVRAALADCPFVVVSDVVRRTDTAAMAHVLLPSAAWSEKDGTVTNSERRISRQRAFLPPAGDARPDWWQLAAVARRMGFEDAFDYAGPHEIFAEYAALTATDNRGARDLDLGGVAADCRRSYDALEPFLWPRPDTARAPKPRLFADGRFHTPDRRARLIPTPYRPAPGARSPDYRLILNTGRIRDQWHTMTRTGKIPRLALHIGEPFLEINPADAERYGLADGGIAEVSSAHGVALLRVVVTTCVAPGAVFAPMHWTDQQSACGRVGVLVSGDTDPVSGQPGLKQTGVAVAPFRAAWFAFAVSRARPALRDVDYWAIAPVSGGWRAELAGRRAPDDVTAFARRLFGMAPEDGDLLAYHDRATSQYRFAVFDSSRLNGALFVGPRPVTASRDWLSDQLETFAGDAAGRLRLLAGRAGAAMRDRGPVICTCFEVGRNEIVDAIESGRCATPEAVGAALKAGTNCGSCRAEIGRLCRERSIAEAG